MLILLASLAVLLILGIPIAYAIGLSSLFFFALNHPDLVQILPQRMFAGFNSYTLMALPLFIGNIDWRAHLGGLAVGIVVAFLWEQIAARRDNARQMRAVIAFAMLIVLLALLAVL